MNKLSRTPASEIFEAAASTRPPLKVVVAGHVDHGKSTLIGRLLHECGMLPDARFQEMRAAAERRGVAFEWAFLLDALQSERNQNITIESSRLWLKRPQRNIVLIDVPGHVQFLKNMVSGGSEADIGLLVVDASEGIADQTARHAFMMHLLGLRHVIAICNKMDAIDYSEWRYKALSEDLLALLEPLGIHLYGCIPVSARDGDNLYHPSQKMKWYGGETLLAALDGFSTGTAEEPAPLRFMVQDVLRSPEGRLYLGRVHAGELKRGMDILISPLNRKAKVVALYANDFQRPIDVAVAGQSVGLSLDYPLFIEGGSLFSELTRPPLIAQNVEADIFPFPGCSVEMNDTLILRIKSLAVNVKITEVTKSKRHPEMLRVRFSAAHPISLDGMETAPENARFLLRHGAHFVAFGWFDAAAITDMRASLRSDKQDITWANHKIDSNKRTLKQEHKGAVVWMTGLPGSGKSTLAMELEKRLFDRGWRAYVLDGDNLRHGLCSDLGFNDIDRIENIRRAGEVAALFADAGMICICAFISPFMEGRSKARSSAEGNFYEVYVKASSSTCAARDPKKLYARAKTGEIKGLTGYDAPYEEPEDPELVIDTEALTVDQSINLLEENIIRWLKKSAHIGVCFEAVTQAALLLGNTLL